jgi:hypothetical protein
MRMIRAIAVWTEVTKLEWRDRRDETGGVLDEAGMIAIGFAAAVMIGAAVYALVSNIELDIGELWGG